MIIPHRAALAPFAMGLVAMLLPVIGCGGGAADPQTPVTKSASLSGCQPSLPAIPTGNRPPGREIGLVDPTPAQWGVGLPDGAPLPLDSSVELPPLHARVAHRFDPQLHVKEAVDAQIYLIFPRNDFTVKPPKTGWVEQPGSDASVVYCGEVRGVPRLTRGGNDEVFWITPLASRPFSIQWQIAGTAQSEPLSTRLRGFTVEVTP